MSNGIKRQIKKQTQKEKIEQIGRVQFEMWLKLDVMSKELRKIQDLLGVSDEKVEENIDGEPDNEPE